MKDISLHSTTFFLHSNGYDEKYNSRMKSRGLLGYKVLSSIIGELERAVFTMLEKKGIC